MEKDDKDSGNKQTTRGGRRSEIKVKEVKVNWRLKYSKCKIPRKSLLSDLTIIFQAFQYGSPINNIDTPSSRYLLCQTSLYEPLSGNTGQAPNPVKKSYARCTQVSSMVNISMETPPVNNGGSKPLSKVQ